MAADVAQTFLSRTRNMANMIRVLPSSQQTLFSHPTSVVAAAWRVGVSFRLSSDELKIRYSLPASGLRLPSPPKSHAPARVDGLWQHTCAELFVAAANTKGYREFNFSANGDWAVYDFVDYRIAATDAVKIPAPNITSTLINDFFHIDVQLAVSALPESHLAQYSATVVLESEDGNLSYWAAFHPGAKPDFHHRDGFVLTLA